ISEDVHAMQARVARLIAAFQAIPREARVALHARLAAPRGRDPLAYAFCAHLHAATQRRLLRVLAGELVPLSVHDAMSPEAFAAHLPTDTIRIEPTPLVVDPRLAPHVTARISLTSEYGPPADGPEVRVGVRVFDAHGGERSADRMAWPPAKR